MSKNNRTIKLMVFVALYCAMAIVLDLVKELLPFTSLWVNGGTIDVALIPLVFASLHLGWKIGTLTGLIEFMISCIIGATTVYLAPNLPVLGFVCDYLIPSIVMGMATILVSKKDDNKHAIFKLEIGILIAMLIRIFSQVVSGVCCWLEGEMSVAIWLSSISYNLSYGLPTMIVLLLIMPLLYKVFERMIKKDL